MKRLCYLLICGLLLCGCGAAETMETVADELEAPAAAVKREILVDLPGEAAAPVMEAGSDRYYLCDDYELSVETLASGDVKNTIRQLSGFDPEDLTVLKTEQDGKPRYDFVWAAQGEEGQRLGRAAIIDDGNYHYTLSVLRNADNTEKSQVVWRTVFESFSLN